MTPTTPLTLQPAAPVKPLLFRTTGYDLLRHMGERIQAKKPVFLSSLNPVFEETVQVSYMLSNLLSPSGKETYKTFYCNSHMEALHGAIKMARSFQHERQRHRGGTRVLLYDRQRYYRNYFDPLDRGTDGALIPGVVFASNADELERSLISHRCGILILSPEPATFPDFFPEVKAYAARTGMVTVLDISRWKLEDIAGAAEHIASGFDIVAWGEALAGFQAPFGAFSTRSSVYAPWNSLRNCLLHSTTYGGNAMVLSYVKKELLQAFPLFAGEKKHLRVLRRIESRPSAKLKLARKYMNAYVSVIYRSARLDIDLRKAEGFHLTVRDGRGREKTIMDCVGGSGCSLRGHNPGDIVDEVVQTHRPGTDYFSRLAGTLTELTGLPRAFQAVSGASAVEIGMMMACLANPSRNRIVIFNGNYAGKTLLALNGTDADHSKYGPLYPKVTVCNPFSAAARADLQAVLTAGDVGLVWFEHIQGTGLLALPPEIISLVNRHRKDYGYFVGVDEILNGVFRTGNFLSIAADRIAPDIVTLSKGLSDMVFPVSVALTTEEVYLRALAQKEEMVAFLEGLYKNQLGAHIAGHALQKALEADISGNVKGVAPQLVRELNAAARQSKLFKSVEGAGLSLRVNMNMNKFPFRLFGYDRSCRIVTSVFYRQSNVLTFFSRFLPPLNLTPAEASRLIESTRRTFRKPAIHFFKVGVWQLISTQWMVAVNKLRRF